MSFRFLLFSSDGDELGEFVTAAEDWEPGDEFFTAQRRRFRILAIADVDEPDSRYTASTRSRRPSRKLR